MKHIDKNLKKTLQGTSGHPHQKGKSTIKVGKTVDKIPNMSVYTGLQSPQKMPVYKHSVTSKFIDKKNSLTEINLLSEIGPQDIMAYTGVASLAIAALPGLLSSIPKAVQDFRYRINGCDKQTDITNRNRCEAREISSVIAKLKSEMSKCNKIKGPKQTECVQKFESKISEFQIRLDQKHGELAKNVQADQL